MRATTRISAALAVSAFLGQASAAPVPNENAFTLYRDSVVQGIDKVWVASFDTDQGYDYNHDNCWIAAKLFQSQEGTETHYCCEPGRVVASSTPTIPTAVDPASVPGTQSLLLEAQDNGRVGAVPFSGSVDWTRGTDERGQPTLVGKASIPARKLGVDLLIRLNPDATVKAAILSRSISMSATASSADR